MAAAGFKKGTEVEVSCDEEGFRGAWFAATIIKPPAKNKVMIEYKTLMADEAGTKPLQEAVDLVQVRPVPPREVNRSFKFSEEVDAYHNDGWWEGVVTEVLPKSRYSVFFRGTREQIHFKPTDLRLHREWVDGNWVPPLEDQVVSSTAEVMAKHAQQQVVSPGSEVKTKHAQQQVVSPGSEVKTKHAQQQKVSHRAEVENKHAQQQVVSPRPEVKSKHAQQQVVPPVAEEKTGKVTVKEKFSNRKRKQMSPVTEMKSCKTTAKEKFSNGTSVEVSSDEEGFVGAWFAATVIETIGKNKFLIEYESLRNDDDTELLREEVDSLHIRPVPPQTIMTDSSFNLLDEVDAFHNDGWWVGVISKVLTGSRYVIYFRCTNEEMEFADTDLRLHQEWIDGKWVVASRALKL